MTYTLYPAYSGPFVIDLSSSAPDVSIDIFGRQSVIIQRPSDLYSAQYGAQIEQLQVEISASDTTWREINNLNPGLYEMAYLGGAITAYAAGPATQWNEAWLGQLSGGSQLIGPTQRPWLRVDGETIPYPEPAFVNPGFTSPELASLAAQGTILEFTLVGTSIEIIYDADTLIGPGSGTAVFDLRRIPVPYGEAGWGIAWSSSPVRPTIKDRKASLPEVSNLTPGLHLLRYTVINRSGQTSWQNYWLWAWKTPPRRIGAKVVDIEILQQDVFNNPRFRTMGIDPAGLLSTPLYPVRPPKSVSVRQYLEQERPTAGNRAERPVTRGNLDVGPRRRGDNEGY